MASSNRRRRKRSAARAARAAGVSAAPPAPEAEAEVAPEPQPMPPAPAGPLPSGRRARMEDAPKAPWSPFPLVELMILAGIVLVILGFVGVASDTAAFVVCGLALITIASLELSLREHFAGFRSHSTLLAGTAAIVAVIPLYFFTALPQLVLLGVGVAVFALCFAALRSAFQRRTGGLGFRA